MLTACETYSKYFPKGERAVDVTYKAALIYYKYNHFQDALRLFAILTNDHPETDLATYAANLTLDIYNLQGDFTAVLDSARKYLAAPKLARQKIKEDVEFRDHLPILIEQAGFKLVETLEKKGQYGLAAERYKAFAQEFPKNSNADLALWNAANDCGKAGDFAHAIAVRKRLISQYPHSKYTPQALHGNGQLFEAAADFGAASTAFEAYAAGYEKQVGGGAKGQSHKHELKVKEKENAPPHEDVYDEQKAQEALTNAAVYRVGLKQFSDAIKDRELYLTLWPNGKSHNQEDSQSEKVFASIADVYEEMGKPSLAIKQLEEHQTHVDHDPMAVMAIEYRLAKLYEKSHNTRVSHKLYEEIADLGKHVNKKKLPPEALDALAHASYELDEPTYAEFDRLKLRLPESELVKSVKAKLKALAQVRSVYSETVELRAAEPAICSLYRVASAEQSMALALNDAPVPAQIRANEELENAYRNALAQQAQPVENAAKADYKSALDQAHEAGIFDDCSDKALEALKRYDPQTYGDLAETVVEVPVGAVALGTSPLLTTVQPRGELDAAPGATPAPATPPVAATPTASVPAPTPAKPATSPAATPPPSDASAADPNVAQTGPATPSPESAEPKD